MEADPGEVGRPTCTEANEPMVQHLAPSLRVLRGMRRPEKMDRCVGGCGSSTVVAAAEVAGTSMREIRRGREGGSRRQRRVVEMGLGCQMEIETQCSC